MRNTVTRFFAAIGITVSLAVVTGCTPAVQKQSIAKQTADRVIDNHVSYQALESAVSKSDAATMYRVKSSVKSQDGTMHTNYSLYGYVNLPDMLSVQVHENSFNISFYQQGQVAYADQLGTWTESNPVTHLNAYQGYDQLVRKAIAAHIPLQQMNQTYVVDEYCDVYRINVANAKLPLPPFLQTASALAGAPQPSSASQSVVQYTFYVGQQSGFVREIQTQTINGVGGLGPISTSTDTTFFDINKDKLAKITVPPTLVKQLENKGS